MGVFVKNYKICFCLFFLLFLNLTCLPSLFAQSFTAFGQPAVNDPLLPISDQESLSSPLQDPFGEELFFDEDKELFSPLFLMVEPLIPRFGLWDKNRDPHSVGTALTPALPGSKVPKPVYFPKKNREGILIADVNQEFAFNREYFFSVSTQYRILSWLGVGVGFGFGYEHLPFVCNLPDPQEEAALAPGSSTDNLKKYPTYYSIAVQNREGAIWGRLTSENFIDSQGNQFLSASLSYGVYRIEMVPALQFYPLQNAGEDLKGIFIEVAPLIGLAVDSPMKVYLDILYEANRIRFITSDVAQKISPLALINQTIRQSANWKLIQDTINKSQENPFVHFFGGGRLNLGWQGVFENGLTLNFSTGIGIDSSRGFYTQLKSSIGYRF